ncbi:hypothetical protein ILUMI_25098 [Ignelater luminosus]|uniref:Chorion peroxidase n=1 Tax=Ignelater luminosus TaxID=2038154 RepID=A0A8K0CB70_IGNLU|nr:hypothetical protein ILUMI_25098 [Ignelater luminosus]
MDTFITVCNIFIIFWVTYFSYGAHVHHKRATVSILSHQKHSDSSDPHHHDFTPAPHRVKSHKDVCLHDAECVLPVQCPAHVHDESLKKCTIATGRSGVCCTTGQNHTGHLSEKGRGHHLVRVDPATLGAVTRHSRVEMAEMHLREVRILRSSRSVIVPYGTASYGHFRNSKLYSMTDLAEVMGVANRALEIALATRAFKDRQGITNHQLEYGMIKEDLRPTPLGAACPTPPVCPPVSPRHQRIDGSCNNFHNPAWGTALSPYSRLLPPSYHDGIWVPRVSEDNGQPLNSPRLISTTLFSDNDLPNHEFTLMLMQYGQFLSHDITQSLDTSFANGSAISCCTEDGSAEIPHELRHHTCMPIIMPKEDAFFSTFKQEQTRELRSLQGGRLKVFNDFGRDLLPLNKDADACLTTEKGSACFSSVDITKRFQV